VKRTNHDETNHTGERRNDATGDDLEGVRHSDPRGLAVGHQAAPLPHSQAEEAAQEAPPRRLHVHAELGARPVGQDAGSGPGEENIGGGRVEVALVEEHQSGTVSMTASRCDVSLKVCSGFAPRSCPLGRTVTSCGAKSASGRCGSSKSRCRICRPASRW
jgi:hypothetical protein